MTDDLILRTPNGDFDLFGNEDIVQTFGIFNLEDLTKRTGEYTNQFKLPLTDHNRMLIEYADFIPSVNTLPYKKLSMQIIVGGLVLRNGFVAIPEISDVIEARFYSGNTVFYDLIKNLYLSDLDWSAYDHIWNLANAVAASANTSGYTYPVMDYGDQNLLSDTVDVRKILPTTYNKTILRLMIEQLGYSYVADFDRTDFDISCVPYSRKNPQVSPEIILLNSVDVGNTNNYSPLIQSTINPYYSYLYDSTLPNITKVFRDNLVLLSTTSIAQNLVYIPVDFNLINTVGSSQNYDFITRKYTAQYSGNYDYDFLCELVDYDYMRFTFNNNIGSYNIYTETRFYVEKVSSGVTSSIQSLASSTGGYQDTGSFNSIPVITQTFITNSINGSVYLNVGDELHFKIRSIFNCTVGAIPSTTIVNGTFNPTVKNTAYLKIDLQPELVFGGLITYSSMLPKMKCNEFLKEISIDFGIILNVDDDNKIITATNIDRIKENIPFHEDWTDILDETNPPTQQFSLDSYAQNNNFKRAEDKSILSTPEDSDYNLVINNANLTLEKDLYLSPFSPSENIDFNGTLTTYINLYNVNTNKFENDVKPRICFSKVVTGLFKFTDGTSTSSLLDTVVIWFSDPANPSQSMGFGSLIPKNSKTMIDVLQNLRLVKANFKLNIIHVKNFNFLIPVYIEQYQSYFIVSQPNQFNYTRPTLTEVELIKLN